MNFFSWARILQIRVTGLVQFCCCLLVFYSVTAFSADDSTVEYKIKAAYLYNFTKFITWPDDFKGANFNICILGNDPFGNIINPIENKTAVGRPIKLIRLRQLANVQCQIIFLGTSISDPVSSKGSLIVRDNFSSIEDDSEAPGLPQAMINFVNKAGKIKLKIDLPMLRQAGLSVSAKLLEVAEVIGESHD
ncbi:MAG: YfiR family protein [Methylococcaceae bacterium]